MSQKSKAELLSSVEALFADLDSEFGKPSKEKKKATAAVEKKAKLEAKVLPDINRITLLMRASNFWKPTAQVLHTVTQICQCCKKETEYVGNLHIRHENRITHTTWDCVMPDSTMYSALPKLQLETTMSIPECAACFRSHIFQMPVPNGVPMSETLLCRTQFWAETHETRKQLSLFS